MSCGDGYTSTKGSSSCNRCEEGYFWMYSTSKEDDTISGECEVCPSGAFCAGGLFQPVARANYWIDRTAAAVMINYISNINT